MVSRLYEINQERMWSERIGKIKEVNQAKKKKINWERLTKKSLEQC